jgi:hypothetical protein
MGIAPAGMGGFSGGFSGGASEFDLPSSFNNNEAPF